MHLLQAYYLASPFPIDRAETAPVPGLRRASGAVTISQLSGYAVSPQPPPHVPNLDCTLHEGAVLLVCLPSGHAPAGFLCCSCCC